MAESPSPAYRRGSFMPEPSARATPSHTRSGSTTSGYSATPTSGELLAQDGRTNSSTGKETAGEATGGDSSHAAAGSDSARSRSITRIRNVLLVLVAVFLALAAITLVVTVRLTGLLSSVQDAQQKRHEPYLLADELKRSSDHLSRFATAYVATEEIRFKQYFQHILDIRDGRIPGPAGYGGLHWELVAAGLRPEPGLTGPPIPPQERMRHAGFTEEEFSLLRDAQARPYNLVDLETRAFYAAEGRVDKGDDYFATSDPGLPI